MRLKYFAALAPFLAFPAPVFALELPSYEATYELQLVQASAGTGPRAAVGTFDAYFAETCDGWDTKSRVVIDLTFRDDSTFTNERFFTSWESKNSDDYRFAVQTKKNGETVEAFKGVAKITDKGGRATYEPLDGDGKKATIVLPPHTMLPVAQSRALLTRAGRGENLVRSVVLNGASSVGPRVISTVIGPAREDGSAPPSAPAIDKSLLNIPAWRMSSAFFNLNEKRDTPNTEVFEEVNAEGIARSFEQNFADFTLSARLTKLRRLEKKACS